MKTIKQIETEIAQLQAEVQALKSKPVKKNPEAGIALYPLENEETYFLIDDYNTTADCKWEGDRIDIQRLASGLIHLDRESAEQKLAAMKTEQLMRVASHEAWVEVGEELDFKSPTQLKLSFSLCSIGGLEIDGDCTDTNTNTYRVKNPFPTKESLEAFRTKVGDEAIINMIKWLGV